MMPLTTGQLASAANVNIQTVRYYERRGLLPLPPRTRSGYRQYPEHAVRRLHFIKRAQKAGFSLEEIWGLLQLRVRRPSVAACAAVETNTRTKIELLEGKIWDLQRMKHGLEVLVESCHARRPTSECPVLETLKSEAEEVERGA